MSRTDEALARRRARDVTIRVVRIGSPEAAAAERGFWSSMTPEQLVELGWVGRPGDLDDLEALEGA